MYYCFLFIRGLTMTLSNSYFYILSIKLKKDSDNLLDKFDGYFGNDIQKYRITWDKVQPSNKNVKAISLNGEDINGGKDIEFLQFGLFDTNGTQLYDIRITTENDVIEKVTNIYFSNQIEGMYIENADKTAMRKILNNERYTLVLE